MGGGGGGGMCLPIIIAVLEGLITPCTHVQQGVKQSVMVLIYYIYAKNFEKRRKSSLFTLYFNGRKLTSQI